MSIISAFRSVLDRNITLSALLTRGSLLSTTTPSPDTVGTWITAGIATTGAAVAVGADKSKRDHAPRSILLYYAKSISDYEQVGVYTRVLDMCASQYMRMLYMYICVWHTGYGSAYPGEEV